MSEAAVTYGQALYDLARAEDLEDVLLQQLTVLAQSFRSEPDFPALLQSHNLSKQERCRILDDSFRDRVHPYVLNFLKLLTENGLARHFPDCAAHFQKCYRRTHNILAVTAVTAVALTDDRLRALTEKLACVTGKTIELSNRVDPTVLGGIRLNYDGKQLDGTVIHRLDAMRSLLKNTVL